MIVRDPEADIYRDITTSFNSVELSVDGEGEALQ